MSSTQLDGNQTLNALDSIETFLRKAEAPDVFIQAIQNSKIAVSKQEVGKLLIVKEESPTTTKYLCPGCGFTYVSVLHTPNCSEKHKDITLTARDNHCINCGQKIEHTSRTEEVVYVES